MEGSNRRRASRGKRGGALRRVVLWLGVLALCFGGGVMIGCRSMPKEEIEARLVALEKNAPLLRTSSIETREFRFRPRAGAEEIDAELRFVRVPAREPGDERNAPVVCVHPTPSSLFSFGDTALGRTAAGEEFEALAQDRDVYLIDVIGHGLTRSTARRYDFQVCADWVAAAIETLGLDGVTLIGNSYGGEFCWRAALDRPDLIGRLVLVDSSGYAREPDDFLSEEKAMRKIPGAGLGWVLNSRERVRNALEPHFAELSEDRLTEVFLTLESSDNWGACVDLVRDEEGHRSAELTSLAQPTLLVWGEMDLAFDVERYARRFERDIPNSRLVVFEETGHYPQEERPARFARTVREFLAEPLEAVR